MAGMLEHLFLWNKYSGANFGMGAGRGSIFKPNSVRFCVGGVASPREAWAMKVVTRGVRAPPPTYESNRKEFEDIPY